VYTPANVLRSSGPCSRSWFTASSSSGAARRRCAPPWPVVGAAVWPLLPLGRRRGGAFSFSLSQRSLRWGGKGKPQWGWWRWTTSSLPPPLLLNPSAARAGRNPCAAPAWTARAPVAAPPPLSARPRSQGQGAGVKGDFPSPVQVRLARGRARPLGVHAGWAVRPRPAPRALVRRDRRRKGGSVTRRVGEDKGADTRGPRDRDREGCG
jgi:hypothetical protein